MAKYYIQSGNVSFVVCGCDVEGAALWAMHRIMDEKICDYEDELAMQEIDPFSLPISETEIAGVPEASPVATVDASCRPFARSTWVEFLQSSSPPACDTLTTGWSNWRPICKKTVSGANGTAGL